MYKWICTCIISYNIVHMDSIIYVYTLMIFDTLSTFQVSFKMWFWVFEFLTGQCDLRFYWWNMISNCDLTRQFCFNCDLVCNCGPICLYLKNIWIVHMYTLKLMYICTLWNRCICKIWALRCYYCILIS